MSTGVPKNFAALILGIASVDYLRNFLIANLQFSNNPLYDMKFFHLRFGQSIFINLLVLLPRVDRDDLALVTLLV